MATQLIHASFNESIQIDFTDHAWFNATSVGKFFNKEPVQWLNLRETAEYISALSDILSEFNSGFLQEFLKISDLSGESSASRAKLLSLVKKTGLVKTKTGSPENGGGTWLHPKLGVAFARWLDVEFSIWCDMQIEKILHPDQSGIKEPKTKKSLPGCLTLDQQDVIKALVKSRVEILPKEKQAKAMIHCWSAIKTKFGKSYKAIDAEHFTSILSLISRLELKDDPLLHVTPLELANLVDQRVAKALEGELLEKEPQAEDPMFHDSNYRSAARRAYNDHLNTCHADMERMGVKSPEWPKINSKLIDGLVSSMLLDSRWVASFDAEMHLSLMPVPMDAMVMSRAQFIKHMTQDLGYIVANPEDVIKKLRS